MKLLHKLTVLLLVLSLLGGAALSEAVSPEDIEARLGLRQVHIRAVGDLMMHEKQLKIARQADGSYDFHQQYALIADSLADADYTIANLETTVGNRRLRPPTRVRDRVASASSRSLRRAPRSPRGVVAIAAMEGARRVTETPTAVARARPLPNRPARPIVP